MTKKIFIFNNDPMSLSAPDCRALFSSTTLFSAAPDIRVGEFNFSMDGLVDPLFVIPGGSTVAMGCTVKPQIETLRAALGEKFDYLGICAGGFLGTQTADLFHVDFSENPYTFRIPKLFDQLRDDGEGYRYNFKMVPDYKSIGPFFLNAAQANLQTRKSYVAGRVSLLLPDNQRPLDQLYVFGPAFIPVTNATAVASDEKPSEEKSEVVARYPDNYRLDVRKDGERGTDYRFFDRPAAIIARRATATHGASLITGTHIEACVKDSKMLEAFREDSRLSVALPADDFDQLKAQQAQSLRQVESLLKNTFKR